MAAAIGRLVNGKFTATIVAPRLDSLELAVDRGKMSEEVLGRLRDRIGVRAASVAASRSGFLQICVDRCGNIRQSVGTNLIGSVMNWPPGSESGSVNSE